MHGSIETVVYTTLRCPTSNLSCFLSLVWSQGSLSRTAGTTRKSIRAAEGACLLLHPVIESARGGVGLLALGLDLLVLGRELQALHGFLQAPVQSSARHIARQHDSG